MPKLSKEESLRRISAADRMLADCGLSDVVGKFDPLEWTPTSYFNFAFSFWMKHVKQQVKRKRHQERHREYLETPEWKAKRDARMNLDEGKCVDCGMPAQCVHHLHYQTWRRESVEADLVSLCHDCHYTRHFGKAAA
jgi:5-methylcytosine-specific restriction endonuclease McrA